MSRGASDGCSSPPRGRGTRRGSSWHPALVAAVYAMWRRGVPGPALVRRAWTLGIWPAAAVAIFVVNSRITVGSWFVTGGFYEHDPTLRRAGAEDAHLGVVGHAPDERLRRRNRRAARGGRVPRARRARAPTDAARLIPLALFAHGGAPLLRVRLGTPFPDPLHDPARRGVRALRGALQSEGSGARTAPALLAIVLVGSLGDRVAALGRHRRR